MAFAISWIPCLGLVGIPIGGLGVILGLWGLIAALVGNGSGAKLAIGGTILSFAAIFIVLAWLLPLRPGVRPFPNANRVNVWRDDEGPAFSVNALQLGSEYRFNAARADQKYLGKTLRVRGVVESIGTDRTKRRYVILSAGVRFGGVQCFFDEPFEDQAAQLVQGRFVTIRGKCEGKTDNVILRGCEIPQLGAGGLPLEAPE
jgi:hypothetical protein